MLIFHTSYKRAGWYVEHGLAVKLCDDPLRIRLTFQPKGPGHACEGEFHLLIPRENHCVVCGAETDLTLHHVVPYQYRRYMPLYKSHSWWDVFAICEKCHNCYEADYALPLKQRFANVYKVPLNGVYNPEEEALNWAGPRARALREHGHEMPPERRIFLLARIAEVLGREPSEDDLLTLSRRVADKSNRRKMGRALTQRHGQMVMDKVTDQEKFVKLWRRHFVRTMNPRFLPQGWDAEGPMHPRKDPARR